MPEKDQMKSFFSWTVCKDTDWDTLCLFSLREAFFDFSPKNSWKDPASNFGVLFPPLRFTFRKVQDLNNSFPSSIFQSRAFFPSRTWIHICSTHLLLLRFCAELFRDPSVNSHFCLLLVFFFPKVNVSLENVDFEHSKTSTCNYQMCLRYTL